MDALYKFLSYTRSRHTVHRSIEAGPSGSNSSEQDSTSTAGSTVSASRPESTSDELDHPALLTSGERFAARVRSARESDFPSLRDVTYLDASASPPFPLRLPQAHTRDLCSNLYSNPHSHSVSSLTTASKVEDVRARVMKELFHLDPAGHTSSRVEAHRHPHHDPTRIERDARDEGWDLVFTSGCTASLKLVGESFFSPLVAAPGDEFWVHDQAHTSLLGIRDLAQAGGARVGVFSLDEPARSEDGLGMAFSRKGRSGSSPGSETKDLPVSSAGSTSHSSTRMKCLPGDPSPESRLIGFPAQCNASGRRWFTPEIFSKVRRSAGEEDHKRAYILLDAASYLSPSQTLNLSEIPYADAPDYIVFSFYKIYGYPTGLGGLLVKRSSAARLREGKRYWGGGTLQAITPGVHRDSPGHAEVGWKVPKDDLAQGLEDGSINVHAIVGISHGPTAWAELFGDDMKERARYVRWLTRRLVRGLERTKHGNGEKVVQLYMDSLAGKSWVEEAVSKDEADDDEDWPDESGDDQGPIVNFNIVHPAGRLVPPTEVDRLACVQNIHLRSGRHCNPGFIVNQLLNGRQDEIVRQFEAGMGCDESANAAVVAASLRVSLGVYNTPEDVDAFLTFIKRFWVFENEALEGEGEVVPDGSSIEGYELSEIRVYPIKSCAGQTIGRGQGWTLTSHGLEFDREWILMDRRTGKGLSQKKHPRMALIKPRIDLAGRRLIVRAGGKEISVDLDDDDQKGDSMESTSMQVCVDTVTPRRSQQYRAIDDWLSDFLSLPCALARQAGPGRHSKLGGPTTDRVPLLLSNESPFLLLNQHSVDKVSDWIAEGGRPDIVAKASSFRGNFVIGRPVIPPGGSAEGAFQEDAVHRFRIGPHTFAPLGACRRCQMVSIDQDTGEKAPETFLTIAKRRRDHRGRILFGTHMMWRDEGHNDTNDNRPIIQVGMKVTMTLSD